MQDARDPAALRAALHYVVSTEIPSEHKSVLIEALTSALRAASERTTREAAEREHSDWSPEDLQNLRDRLQGKVAKSWQDADEQLMQLAGALHRSAEEVRSKALEMGAGVGIDYRLAKASQQSKDDY